MRHLIVAAALSLSCSAMAETWTVDDDGPADFDNIQAAVDAASDGDVVLIEPGTYVGAGDQVVNLTNKSLTLRSTAGREETIVSGSDTRVGLFVSDDGSLDDVTIEGITFRNCTTALDIHWAVSNITDCLVEDNTVGMFLHSAHGSLIEHCVFRRNKLNGSGSDGGGVKITYGNPITMTNCLFESNSAPQGGGLRVFYASPTLIACTFYQNSVGGQFASGGAIFCEHQNSTITLLDCTVSESPVGCGIVALSGEIHIGGTILCGNLPENICSGGVVDMGGNIDVPDCDDLDQDGIPYDEDNCPLHNPEQTDCNGNGIGDVCDLADGTSQDVDGSDVPDECECLADVDSSGAVEISDVLTVIAQWGNAGPLGDVNYDGIVDTDDLLAVLSAWGPCP